MKTARGIIICIHYICSTKNHLLRKKIKYINYWYLPFPLTMTELLLQGEILELLQVYRSYAQISNNELNKELTDKEQVGHKMKPDKQNLPKAKNPLCYTTKLPYQPVGKDHAMLTVSKLVWLSSPSSSSQPLQIFCRDKISPH